MKQNVTVPNIFEVMYELAECTLQIIFVHITLSCKVSNYDCLILMVCKKFDEYSQYFLNGTLRKESANLNLSGLFLILSLRN